MKTCRIDLGVAMVTACPADELLTAMATREPSARTRMACFCEASLLAGALTNPQVAGILGQSDWVFADGVAVKIVASLHGIPFSERMPGPTFLLAACEFGQSHGWRHFFYGGGAGVADKLAENLKARFPRMQVAGTLCPPFRDLTPHEEVAFARTIEAARPDVLWVALGSPRQELWAHQHRASLRVPFIFPVGAAFDFHSGNRPWAPIWIRLIGMEWLFRMITGGRRVFFRNCRCVATVGRFIVGEFIRIRVRKMHMQDKV